MIRFTVLLAIIMMMAFPATAQERRGAPAGNFDFYVLALSWSPAYCMREGERADPLQCDAVPPKGFVVHGLWPQYQRGWPAYCLPEPVIVSRDVLQSVQHIMPYGLARYQWRKHGSCSGLGPSAYFALMRRAAARVQIPVAFSNGWRVPKRARVKDILDAFISANPGLRSDMIAINCDGQGLSEVRICLARHGEGFVACPEVARRSCRRDTLVTGAAP